MLLPLPLAGSVEKKQSTKVRQKLSVVNASNMIITLTLKDGGKVEAENMPAPYLLSKYKPEDIESIEINHNKEERDYTPSFIPKFMRK